jgi:hypothetical protein
LRPEQQAASQLARNAPAPTPASQQALLLGTCFRLAQQKAANTFHLLATTQLNIHQPPTLASVNMRGTTSSRAALLTLFSLLFLLASAPFGVVRADDDSDDDGEAGSSSTSTISSTCTSDLPDFDYMVSPLSDTKFYWKLSPDGADMISRIVRTGTDGYFSLGPNLSSRMPGTDAIFALANEGVFQYDVTGYASSQVRRRDPQWLTGTSIQYVNGVLTADFTRPLVSPNGSGKDISTTGPTTFVWASSSSTSVSRHNRQGSFSVEVGSCQGGVAGASGISSGSLLDSLDYMAAHGTIMFITWGVLVPLGITIAMMKPSWWFNAHRVIQGLAMVLGVLGVIAAVVGKDQQWGGPHLAGTHGKVGVAVTVLGWFQLVNATLRPAAPKQGDEKTTARSSWEVLHRLTSSAAVGLAWWTIFTGMDLYGVKQSKETAVIVVLAIFTAIAVFASLRKLCQPRSVAPNKQATSDMEMHVVS